MGPKPGADIGPKATFVGWSRAEIAGRLLDLGVPYDITQSCYRDANRR